MTDHGDSTGKFSELRKRAEKRLRGQLSHIHELSVEESQRLIHELEVHQIELEMQNEELRQAQQELEAARDRYADLYDFAPIGYITVGKDGLILQANLTAAMLLGINRGDLVHQTLSRFITPQSQDAWYLHYRQVMSDAKSQSIELQLRRPDGATFDAQLESIATLDDQGNRHQCRTTLCDISWRKRLERKIHKLNAELQERVDERTEQLVKTNEALVNEVTAHKRTELELQVLNETLEQRVALRTAEAERRAQELEQFAYVASHDLKAPLRAIGNLASWLEEDLAGKLTKDTREQLTLLEDRVEYMQALIEGLLKYSRVGAMEGSKESIDTAQLLAEIIDSLSPPEGFVIDLVPDMPTLRTDRLQLGQVFANLIGNSIKHHGGEQGHIWIKVRDDGGYYEFSVTDDGPGIAPEYHKKVFMIFQTLATKDYDSDSGIGLALVKKIVQEQGGLITLDSEEGKGATFMFTWPKET